MPKSTSLRTARRFLRMSRAHWGVLITATAALILTALAGLVTPALVRRLTGDLAAGTLTSSLLAVYALVLAGSFLLRAVCRFLSMYLSHVAAWRFVGDLTAQVYAKLQTLSQRWFADKQTGELMSRTVNDTRLLEVLIAHSLPDLLSNLVILLGVSVMMLLINWQLALFTLLPTPLVLAAGMIFSRKVAPLFRYNQEVVGDLSGLLQDNLSGLREIQAFCREEREHGRVSAFCKFYSKVNIRANFANGIFHPSVELLTSLGTLTVMALGGVFAMRGTLPPADIVGFFMYLALFYQPILTLARLVEDVQSACAGGARVLEVLDTPADIADPPGAPALPRIRGAVAFEHVSFRYNAVEPVLDDISFTVRPGEMVALVGATGVGKTTVMSLLERFYDPDGGRVLLDGTDIRTVTLASLRANLSLVLQDVFLFNGTVEDNIAYGLDGCTHEQVVAAAKTACAHDFIDALPDGYATLIGERGMRLSGGQKQRLAIARAVLRDTPVLLLDEATSAVDNETEAAIQQAIETLAGRRTVVVIAHRLSTVRRADKILLIEDGVIKESGTHEELLALDGGYAKLHGTKGI